MITIFLSILCAIIWGLAELYYKKNTYKYRTISILFYRYIFQIIIYLFIIVIMDLKTFTRFDIKIYLFLVPLFISSSIIGQALYTLSIKNENLSIVSPIMASDPIYIILIGMMLFNEKISIYSLVALLIICFSVFALNFINSNKKKKAKKIAIFLASSYAFMTAISTMFEKSVYLGGYTVTDLYFHYIFLLLLAIITLLIYMKIKGQKLEKIDENLILGYSFNQGGYVLYSFLISTAYVSLVAPLTGLYSVVTHFLAIKVLKEKLSFKQNLCIFLIIISTIFLLIFNS